MEFGFNRNDSDEDSNNDDDDLFDGHDFEPVTDQILTLVMQEGLDDIYTGDIFLRKKHAQSG